MKMLLAIINHDDSRNVMNDLVKSGFSITKLASTGGFLRAGNVTILIGLDDSRLNEALAIIREHSITRRQLVPSMADLGMTAVSSAPIEISVGGATVFVLNVEQFEKM